MYHICMRVKRKSMKERPREREREREFAKLINKNLVLPF